MIDADADDNDWCWWQWLMQGLPAALWDLCPCEAFQAAQSASTKRRQVYLHPPPDETIIIINTIVIVIIIIITIVIIIIIFSILHLAVAATSAVRSNSFLDDESISLFPSPEVRFLTFFPSPGVCFHFLIRSRSFVSHLFFFPSSGFFSQQCMDFCPPFLDEILHHLFITLNRQQDWPLFPQCWSITEMWKLTASKHGSKFVCR